MKFTEQWLKSHLKTSATTADISDRLTNLGLEVEEIIERKDLQGFMTVSYTLLEVYKRQIYHRS